MRSFQRTLPSNKTKPTMINLKKIAKISIFYLSIVILIPHLIMRLTNKEVINKDVKRWLDIKKKHYNTIIGFTYLLLCYPEFRSLFYHRIGKIKSLVCRYLPGRTNLYLQTKKIGGGFYIGHGWGTVVNAKSIGENCGVAQNCTIGSRNLSKPILKDGCMIWAHSIVLGDITIGYYSHIGAGAVVVKDVPDHSVVVPAKSKIIKVDDKRVEISL